MTKSLCAKVKKGGDIKIQYAECPKGTTAVYRCLSTPQVGDNKMVSLIAEAISVCSDNHDNVTIALTAEGDSTSERLDARDISRRTGAVEYSVKYEDGTPWFSFVVGQKGKSILKLGTQDSLSSTFTCTRD